MEYYSMEEETILKKLERLLKKHRLLKSKKLKRIKDKKLKYGQWIYEDDEEGDDDLLSQPELMEEALKEYMYQFGLSIYQNKQGDYYFKRFIEGDEVRDFNELDAHHFAMRSREPNFIEKLLETVPENKVCLTTNIENAVLDLYEKDAIMTDILEQMIEQEMTKCDILIDSIEKSEKLQQEELLEQEVSLDKNIEQEKIEEDTLEEENIIDDVYDESTEEYESPVNPDDDDTTVPPIEEEQLEEAYECGGKGERVEKVRLVKPKKIRRVSHNNKTQEQAIPVVALTKDNSNNR